MRIPVPPRAHRGSIQYMIISLHCALSSPPVPNVFGTFGTGGERIRYVRAGVGRTIYLMYQVYILKDSFGKFYKGVTNNLGRRLAEHKSGHTKSTKQLKNPVVVYTEEYDNFKQAR